MRFRVQTILISAQGKISSCTPNFPLGSPPLGPASRPPPEAGCTQICCVSSEVLTCDLSLHTCFYAHLLFFVQQNSLVFILRKLREWLHHPFGHVDSTDDVGRSVREQGLRVSSWKGLWCLRSPEHLAQDSCSFPSWEQDRLA